MKKTPILIFIMACLASQCFAQSARKVKCRVVLFERGTDDPAEVYVSGIKPGEFSSAKLSIGIETPAVEFTIPDTGKVLFRAQGSQESPVIASGTLPAGQNFYIFLLPDTNKEDSIQYQVYVMDDTTQSIPRGGMMVANLSKSSVRIELGEHKYQLPTARITTIPQPTKRDPYDQANFMVSYQDNAKWTPIKSGLRRCGASDCSIAFVFNTPQGPPSTKIYMRAIPLIPANP